MGTSTRRVALVALVALLALPTASPAQEAEARRLYLNAERLQQEGDLDAAVEEFRFLAEQFPSSEWADDSLLQVALMRWRAGDAAGAATTAQRLRDGYPTSSSAAGGLYILAELRAAAADSERELGAAKDDFRRIALSFPVQRYPTLQWRGLAKARAGEISLLLGDDIEAAGILIDTIDNESSALASGRAAIAFSELLARQGNWQAAGQALQQVIERPMPADDAEWAVIVARAGRRASLVHRMVVRPAAGEHPWARAFPWAARGTEMDRPIGVAADDLGQLVIADEGDDVAVVLDADRGVIARRTLQNPRKPWWTPAGTPMALTEGYAARIDTRDSTYFTTQGGRDPGPLQKLLSGASGLYGDWVVLDEDRRRMVLFDRDAGYVRSPINNTRAEPVDVALDRRGRIYVLDRENRNVARYLPDGTADGTVASGRWERPEAIAIDVLDNLYVLDRDTRRIEVFGPDGIRRAAIGPDLPGGLTLRDPRDVAVDGSGRLFVADRSLDTITMLQ